MIDIKILDLYTKYINLKQVCILSGLNYGTIKTKIRRFRNNQNTSLTPWQSEQLLNGFRKIGINELMLRNLN